jgi:FlaA1/EpsC-like NDP-sugar epimerase
VPIYAGLNRTGELVKKLRASTLLFLPPFTGPGKIREVVDDLSEKQIACDYRVIPSLDEIASGRVDVSGIRRVAIEDLLYRVPYEIASDMLVHAIGGKRVLVSGAGGSIGSEICRQLLRYRPAVIVLFEVSEFHLFEIERELRSAAKEAGVELIACAGDVRRSEQLRAAIRQGGGIDLFYHAAAYKHVDLMERNALSCFQNNVVGTQAAIGVAEEEGVKDFVLISTDKAVRPTSLMGASKRLAERLVIERPARGTKCKAVRFGNVLGSNGSVIPIFRQQIERGGPVTVTSKEVTRYFMTIPEAVELVLAAGAIPEDRRIFVLEMGEAVKIDEMARRMIELSGLVPDVDIPVVYTGLKPGEKEYEELLTDDEDVVRTDLDRIWVVKKNGGEELEPVDVGLILDLIDEGDEKALRAYADSLIRGSLLLKPEAARR